MRRVAVVAVLALAACQHPAPTPAPQPAADTTATHPAPDTVQKGWTAGNLVIGDGVVVVRARYGGRVFVGVGTASRTIAFTFDADQVDQFVDDVRAMLPPHRSTGHPTPILQEKESSRAMSFARVGKGANATYHFYFADEQLQGFAVPSTVAEAKGLLAALVRGAIVAHEATPDKPAPPPTPTH
jgi:hypothetical protein